MDRNATLPEVLRHGVDGVGLLIHSLGLVVEEQGLRVGFMRPAKSLLNICSALSREAYARLVVPDGVFEFAFFVQRFIDHIPGEDLSGVVLHLGCDVIMKEFGQLPCGEASFREPFWIVVIPDKAMPADLHFMGSCKADNFITLPEVETLVAAHHPPLHAPPTTS